MFDRTLTNTHRCTTTQQLTTQQQVYVQEGPEGVPLPADQRIDPWDHCYFVGHTNVDGQEGQAAMSVCHGKLDGVMETPMGMFGIQPLPAVSRDGDETLRVVWPR